MTKRFKFGILFGDAPDHPPAEIAPGWELAEIPVSLLVKPFESEANWGQKQEEIASWNLPPIQVSSHFIQYWGLTPVGPGVDWEQLEFWTGRAFARLAGLGVKVAGVYGGFFKLPAGFSKTTATDQALRWVNLLADHAEQHGLLVALEPIADPETLWSTYLDGIAFAKNEVGRPSIRVMADLAYFIRGNQPLEHIAREPEYCLHVHIAGDGGQPGVGDRVDLHTHLFRVLRDIGYEGGVSAACPWVNTEGEELDFGVETAKSLRYLNDLRDKVFSE
jgi:sugar phosphate isomerase/epimerase